MSDLFKELIEFGKREWERRDAFEFLPYLWEKMAPEYHVGLTGSVLYRGWSLKDLDVIIYPRSEVTKEFDPVRVRQLLSEAGLTPRSISNEHASCNGDVHGSKWENRLVEIWEWKGKRVDVFFFNGKYKDSEPDLEPFAYPAASLPAPNAKHLPKTHKYGFFDDDIIF